MLRANLRFVVAAGVVTVGDVDDVLAVAFHVVAEAEARHDGVGVDADEPPGRLASDPLVAQAEVCRDTCC